jgi:phosphate transport system permease protein
LTAIPDDTPLTRRKAVQRPGDRIFGGAAIGSGVVILALLAGVAIFLVVNAIPALSAGADEIPGDGGLIQYIAPLAFGTLLGAAIAIVIAVPLAVGVSLFISLYAPRRLAQPLGYVVDLLAAVPSIVYGLWGIFVLGPASVGLGDWLEKTLGFIPLFQGPASATGRTMLVVGIVLAVMILPIITAVTREVFTQTPRAHIEAALALGATRWETITGAVVPYARSGIIGGIILGLGRALGETMAVTMVIGNRHELSASLFAPGYTMASLIANEFSEATSDLHLSALMAVGFVLFLITLLVNGIARWLVWRTSGKRA